MTQMLAELTLEDISGRSEKIRNGLINEHNKKYK